MSEKFTLPTETVELPSLGKVYSIENPLSSGKIEMKYMTAKEEDILTNTNFIEKGIVIDKLLQSMIVSKIDYNELILGDKNAILVAARILGYGAEYPVEVTDKYGKKVSTTINSLERSCIIRAILKIYFALFPYMKYNIRNIGVFEHIGNYIGNFL